MAGTKYLTAPIPSTRMPAGVPYIISNEAAERFSFYGMKCILIIFMTQYLLGRDGELAVMQEEKAKFWYHTFTSAVYFTPLLGALLSDIFLGKYRTIIILSIVYCLGHLALALDETRIGLFTGPGPHRYRIGRDLNPACRPTWAISSARPTPICWRKYSVGFISPSTLDRAYLPC